ncbi:MAG TPA: hypothetical protein VMI94_25515 [Bryobacteraceae bacterium]|nr:hypothetical protein [Bryobacteraceae bacterium]
MLRKQAALPSCQSATYVDLVRVTTLQAHVVARGHGQMSDAALAFSIHNEHHASALVQAARLPEVAARNEYLRSLKIFSELLVAGELPN